MKYLIFLAAAVVVASAAVVKREVKLPEYFPSGCPRNLNQRDLNECIRKNIQNVIPAFSKGEKLFSIEPVEPITVSEARVNFKREPFDFQALVRNTKVSGVSGINVRDVRANLSDENRFDLEIDVLFPTMTVAGDFKMDGKFGNFPFSGKGPYNIDFTDVAATWHLIGETYTKDGEKYIQIKRFIPNYSVGSMKASAENLVDGAPELTTLVMSIINQVDQFSVEAMKPFLAPVIEKTLKRFSNRVFMRVPYDALFPAT